MTTGFISITMTTADKASALRIAEALVQERLAGCVNIIDNITSVYFWQDTLQKSPEVMLIIKTRTNLFETVSKRVKALHDYECPCLVAEPLVAGDAAYLAWLKSQTL